MEVHIGVIHTPKEIVFEVEGDPEALVARVEEAVASGKSFVWLEDGKGRRVGVPADKVGYVEIVVDDPARKVGFGR